ncbi:DUF1850 domain-containing protein [Salinicola halimionae]|uniref:DUF1850 domain-containing protein n=1 Tax=Salinicola halimionae TaxID=1949081 RepID=UPI000DA25A9E|nr:DUF1850 domain-containing protein [Salinicola halimionae]
MTRKIWVSLVAVVILVIATAAYPLPWLVIRDGPQWRFAFPGWQGTTFTLRWMHSVEKEDWEEWFAVTADDAIEITGTRFKTFGAGAPSHAGTETHLEDGWVVMTGIDRVVDPLAVQAAVEEHYRLIFAGHTVPLARGDPPRILTFSILRVPLWQVLPALVRPWLS